MVKVLTAGEHGLKGIKRTVSADVRERTATRVAYYRQLGVKWYNEKIVRQQEKEEAASETEQIGSSSSCAQTGSSAATQIERPRGSQESDRGRGEKRDRNVHRSNADRKGKGEIDRFTPEHASSCAGPKKDPVRRSKCKVGPAAGFPPPTPDWSINPQFQGKVTTATSTTWTEVTRGEGYFEWSRVNGEGLQDWLTASHREGREWKITKRETTSR
jgi:hypothetical protein